MKLKVIFLILCVIQLTGCVSWLKRPVKTQIVQVRVPLLYCPPPKNVIPPKPKLYIHQLSDNPTNEEIAKAYVASIKQLQQYSLSLKIAIDNYAKISKVYAKMREQFINDWNAIRSLEYDIDPDDIESFSKGIPVKVQQ